MRRPFLLAALALAAPFASAEEALQHPPPLRGDDLPPLHLEKRTSDWVGAPPRRHDQATRRASISARTRKACKQASGSTRRQRRRCRR